jgi:hypothetical protein
MRKRLMLFATLVLTIVALALPSTAAAASPYTYVVLENSCSGDEPEITVKMIKPAGYHPDKFTIDARGQHRNIGATRWWNESARTHFQVWVPNQYAKWSWKKSLSWNPPDSQWHRIKVTMRVWRNGSIIAYKTINSVAC